MIIEQGDSHVQLFSVGRGSAKRKKGGKSDFERQISISNWGGRGNNSVQSKKKALGYDKGWKRVGRKDVAVKLGYGATRSIKLELKQKRLT